MKSEIKPLRFAVLLSTFNGAAYLTALLESIRKQNWPHWDLWIRDDGSHDGTFEILEDFAMRSKSEGMTGNRVHVIRGENAGISGSFFQLLEQAGDDYGGYAFCDQDDIWLPEKLERAAQALKEGQPMLYHARQWLMDQNSGKRELSARPANTGFANALVQNQVVGCTLVVNSRLRSCVLQALRSTDGLHSRIIMHDWWCYLLGSGIGTIHYDPHPVILFRRHEESTTPVAAGLFEIMRKRLSTFRKHGWSVSHIMVQAEILSRHFSSDASGMEYPGHEQARSVRDPGVRQAPDQPESPAGVARCRLPDHHQELLESLLELRSAGFLKRLRYLFSGKHHRTGLFETAFFRLLILMKRF